ncbi:hypothetical protein QJQ45_023843, partial [Haematococcus lacustris]
MQAAERIRGTVAAGAYYEAQQMYKAAYHRHRSRKQLADSYSILKDGAVQQLQAGQVTCGIELGLLLVEAFTLDALPATPEALQPLLDIIQALPPLPDSSTPRGSSASSAAAADPGTSASGTTASGGVAPDAGSALKEYVRFITAAVKWANRSKTRPGAAVLHDAFASLLWRHCGEQQLARVALHFSRGEDARGYATGQAAAAPPAPPAAPPCCWSSLASPDYAVLQGCMAAAPTQERDLFITRAVLQCLAAARQGTTARQLHHAHQLLLALDPAGDGPARLPLVNFLHMLIQALQRQSLPLVRLLRDRYQVLLDLDPGFDELMVRIEAVFLKPAMDQFVVRGISAADAADNLHRELLMHNEKRFQMSLDRQAAMIEKRLLGTTNFGPPPRLNLAASPSTPPALARTGKAHEIGGILLGFSPPCKGE